LVVLAKCAASWVTTGLPVALASPILGFVVDLEARDIPILFASLLIGTPALTLVGGVAAALTLGARRAAVLSALLVLPLYVPPLVFGTAAVEASATGGSARPHLLILGALSLLALALAPSASAAALRLALE